MSKASSDAAYGGVSVFGLLGITFVVLKLCGVIDWSWWWVTLPFWGLTALFMAIVIILIAAGAIAILLERK